MNPTEPPFDASAETSQEGVTPVQVFSSAAIPVAPGAALGPRLGRPVRTGSPAAPNGVPKAAEQTDRVPDSGAS